MHHDIAVGCGAEEMRIVSLLHGATINTTMKRGINIPNTYSLKFHQIEQNKEWEWKNDMIGVVEFERHERWVCWMNFISFVEDELNLCHELLILLPMGLSYQCSSCCRCLWILMIGLAYSRFSGDNVCHGNDKDQDSVGNLHSSFCALNDVGVCYV